MYMYDVGVNICVELRAYMLIVELVSEYKWVKVSSLGKIVE